MMKRLINKIDIGFRLHFKGVECKTNFLHYSPKGKWTLYLQYPIKMLFV